MQALADSLKTDRHQVLPCIKYEVLSRRPIYDSFKKFCERMGDDFMNFPEFEFWYMRFHNGDMDMDYNRSEDPQPKELLQLPVEIVEKIVEKLDLTERLITRNVCKPLRTIVDRCKLKFKSIELLELRVDAVALCFDCNQLIRYYLNPNKLGITIIHEEREIQKKGNDAVGFAMTDLKAIMKAPNLELDSLTITGNWKDSSLVEKALNCFKEVSDFSKTQLKVKAIEISSINTDLIAPCLTLLKPGFLESIRVNHVSDEISNTEQWRQAKSGRYYNSPGVNPTEIKQFLHFEEFDVHVNSMSAENMVQVKEMLFTSPSFKKCKIDKVARPQITIDMISTALGLPVQEDTVYVPYPSSTDVLVIAVVEGCIDIEERSF